MAQKVFISYSRHDRATAQALRNDLQQAQFDVFLDDELSGGQSWWTTLLHHIRDCDVFMPVLSQEWLKSTPCRLESDYAAATRRNFLPVSLDDVSPKLVAPVIAETQWVGYSIEDKHAILRLVGALHGLPPSSPLPDPLPAEPTVPISYLTELRDKVAVGQEMGRTDQELLLTEFRRRLNDDENDRSELVLLLGQFRRRDDVNFHVANDIDALLQRVEQLESRQSAGTPGGSASTDTAAGTGPPWTQGDEVGPTSSAPPPPPPTDFTPPAQGGFTGQPAADQGWAGQGPAGPGPMPAGPMGAPGSPPWQPALAEPAKGKITASYVLSAIAVLFIPILFGPLAILLGYLAKNEGNPKGSTAMKVGAAATVIGFIFSAWYLSQ